MGTDSHEGISCLIRTIYNGRRKVFKKFKTDTEKLNTVCISLEVTETIRTSKITRRTWSWQKTSFSWQYQFVYSVTLTYFPSGALYWMDQLFIINTNFVKEGRFLSNEHFLIITGIKIVIWTQWCPKKCILVRVSVGMLYILYVGWKKNLNLVEPSVLGTRTWNLYFVNPTCSHYLQY